MIFLEAGSFLMGSPNEDLRRDRDELQHRVTLTKGFYICSTEVTQSQWRTIMSTETWNGEGHPRSGDNLPAGGMSISAAKRFCEALTKRDGESGKLPDGYAYRLPTEAEWEYACRAGSKTFYFFGDNEKSIRAYARCNWNIKAEGVHEVAKFKPNAWGLYDMHGNAWEMCLDRATWEVGPGAIRHLVNDVYRNGVKDPLATQGTDVIIRGGAWLSPVKECRSANRSGMDDKNGRPEYSLRPVLAPST